MIDRLNTPFLESGQALPDCQLEEGVSTVPRRRRGPGQPIYIVLSGGGRFLDDTYHKIT